MKLFFASDLHGSLPATEKVLSLFEQSGADTLVLLGDLLNHGPRNPIPNGTYIRMSNVKLFAVGGESESFINISETGTWDISDSYLLISPSEFKNISSSQSKDFTPEQLELITQFFKMDAQQSRRIDVVNEKTLLLTSLSHGSTVLFIN